MFNSEYDRLAYFYKQQWVSDAQLRLYVQFGVINATEYRTITGKRYNS
ncbi:XkdX family protein [Paenibacillus cisolokensis]